MTIERAPKHSAGWDADNIYTDITIGRYQRINHTVTPAGKRVQS